MNQYEEQQEARRERYLAKANVADGESDRRFNSHNIQTLRGMGGEPIKIGHHSEKRHRRLIEKADNDMRKSIEATKKAEHYRYKAAGVGSGGISADDPEALVKLREQLEAKERLQATMKAANKIIRSKPKYKSTPEKLKKLVEIDGLSETVARSLFFAGRTGFASYQLTNNNANIKRIQGRIRVLEAARAMQAKGPAEPIVGEGFQIEEHPDENRIWVVFDAKPPRETTKMMRSYGWKWSPTRTAWVRHLNANGRYSAKRVAEELQLI